MNDEVVKMINQKREEQERIKENSKEDLCLQLAENSKKFYLEVWEKLINNYYEHKCSIVSTSYILYKESDMKDISNYYFYTENYAPYFELGLNDVVFVLPKNNDETKTYYPISLASFETNVTEDEFQYQKGKEHGIDVLYVYTTSSVLEKHIKAASEKGTAKVLK